MPCLLVLGMVHCLAVVYHLGMLAGKFQHSVFHLSHCIHSDLFYPACPLHFRIGKSIQHSPVGSTHTAPSHMMHNCLELVHQWVHLMVPRMESCLVRVLSVLRSVQVSHHQLLVRMY